MVNAEIIILAMGSIFRSEDMMFGKNFDIASTQRRAGNGRVVVPMRFCKLKTGFM